MRREQLRFGSATLALNHELSSRLELVVAVGLSAVLRVRIQPEHDTHRSVFRQSFFGKAQQVEAAEVTLDGLDDLPHRRGVVAPEEHLASGLGGEAAQCILRFLDPPQAGQWSVRNRASGRARSHLNSLRLDRVEPNPLGVGLLQHLVEGGGPVEGGVESGRGVLLSGEQ